MPNTLEVVEGEPKRLELGGDAAEAAAAPKIFDVAVGAAAAAVEGLPKTGACGAAPNTDVCCGVC